MQGSESRLNELRQKLREASDRNMVVWTAKSTFIQNGRELLAQYAERLFGEDLRNSDAAMKEAKRLVEVEQIRLQDGNPLIGRRVQRKVFERYGNGVVKFIPGILELMTHETQLSDTQTISKPDVGTIFVRLLKKDGSPSLATDKYIDHVWRFIEGE